MRKIIKRSLILLSSVTILFGTLYIIGLKNKKPIASNKPFKIVSIKHTKDNKTDKVKDATKLPKTPGGQELYHLINVNDGQNVAYLTFDDGPSPNTPEILDILKKDNIKATFFIIGKNAEIYPKFLIREKNEGHVIAMHSYSHQPAIIYKNPEAYLKDLQECSDAMSSVLKPDDYDKWLIRFPEGSFAVKNKPRFREAIAAAGYYYVDWNAYDGDADHFQMATPQYLMNELAKSVGNQHHVVILMHDAATKKIYSRYITTIYRLFKIKRIYL